MYKNINEDQILKMLEGKPFSVDELGRMVIDDPHIMDLIIGSLGEASLEGGDALWNGACSNGHCLI